MCVVYEVVAVSLCVRSSRLIWRACPIAGSSGELRRDSTDHLSQPAGDERAKPRWVKELRGRQRSLESNYRVKSLTSNVNCTFLSCCVATSTSATHYVALCQALRPPLSASFSESRCSSPISRSFVQPLTTATNNAAPSPYRSYPAMLR